MSIPHHSIPLALFSLLGALYCFRGGVCQNTAAERGAMVDMKQKVPVNKNAGRMPELAQIGKHPEPFENPLRLQKLSDPPNLDFGRAGLPAFRLGEDVRLPAAIMADADPRSLDGSSVVSEANRMIIGWFYG